MRLVRGGRDGGGQPLRSAGLAPRQRPETPSSSIGGATRLTNPGGTPLGAVMRRKHMLLNLCIAADPGDEDDNTDLDDSDGKGGNPSPGHGG